MKDFIAYCGSDCEKCEARLVTVGGDSALLEKAAKHWSELNGVEITPAMINCTGCRIDGVKTPYCEDLCPIRQCAMGKRYETCGDCHEVDTCERLAVILRNNPNAKDNLKPKTVISFHDSDRQEHWLEEIKRSDWGAGALLHELLSEGTFFEAVGEGSRVLLLTEGDELISYCTYARLDDIQPTELTPWMGFIYTFPEHRGHRYAGLLFAEVDRVAREEGVGQVYISTNHIGLYEKYGCEFLTMMNDMDGKPSRVYVKKIRMETERILLRRWKDSDAEALYKYASDPDVGPRAGWCPHHSVEESLEIIRTVFNNDTTWAIELKETREVIGAIGYGPSCDCNLPARDGEPIMGYWIAKPYWNQGICTEALSLMLDHIRLTTDIPSLIGGHFVDNPASGRVMEKCGFAATGETVIDENQYQGKDRPIRVLRLVLA